MTAIIAGANRTPYDFADLAYVVHEMRREAGLTQIELAKLAGVGKSTVYDLEKGKQAVQLDKLLNILGVLNVKLLIEAPVRGERENSQRISV